MAQFDIDRAGQFAHAKDDFALLARHGGIKIAFVAENAQGRVYRANVVLDLGKAIPDASGTGWRALKAGL